MKVQPSAGNNEAVSREIILAAYKASWTLKKLGRELRELGK